MIFSEIDLCGDGRVDFEEFEMGMFMLGLDLDEKEAKAEFAKMDADGGGTIRFEELCVHAAEMACHDMVKMADDLPRDHKLKAKKELKKRAKKTPAWKGQATTKSKAQRPLSSPEASSKQIS